MSLTQQILEKVRSDPGCTQTDILAALPPGTSSRSVTSLLVQLRNGKALVNRGNTRATRWYVVTDERAIAQKYLRLAEDILITLPTIHHTRRRNHLAKILQDLGES